MLANNWIQDVIKRDMWHSVSSDLNASPDNPRASRQALLKVKLPCQAVQHILRLLTGKSSSSNWWICRQTAEITTVNSVCKCTSLLFIHSPPRPDILTSVLIYNEPPLDKSSSFSAFSLGCVFCSWYLTMQFDDIFNAFRISSFLSNAPLQGLQPFNIAPESCLSPCSPYSTRSLPSSFIVPPKLPPE